MRAWEKQEGEGTRAYEAFALYRDLGPARSLTKVAQELSKSRTLIARWSSTHDWVSRVEALEARDEMIVRERLEERLEEQAADHAARRAALLDKALEIAEQAADQALLMARWPLAEKVYDAEDGTTVVVTPARWSKANIRPLFEIAVLAAADKLPKADDEQTEAELDFSEMTDEEIKVYIRLSEKLKVKRA